MSIVQFMRILWARRLFVIVATLSFFAAAVLVILIIPPRYQAQARVMLDLVKPDPVTGQVLASQFARAYTATQTELIRDYQVAGRVVDNLGWMNDANLQRAYQERSTDDGLDFRRWLAQQVIDGTAARPLEGTNLVEVSYISSTPEGAKIMADAVIKAYVDTSLGYRRETAARDAEWFERQTEVVKRKLIEAETTKTSFERANGLILQEDNTDIDSARLMALAGQSAPTGMGAIGASSSPAAGALAQAEAALAQATQSLGPNHPELLELRSRRDALAAQVAADRSAAGAAAGATASGTGALDRAVASQRARVIANRDKLERLRQLQADVTVRREQYTKTAARAAELRQEAEVADTGVTVLGPALTPESPIFPKRLPILLGAIAFGGAMGIGVALLIELLGRRIRGVEDLHAAAGAPLLGVIGMRSEGDPGGEASGGFLKKRIAPMRRMVEA